MLPKRATHSHPPEQEPTDGVRGLLARLMFVLMLLSPAACTEEPPPTPRSADKPAPQSNRPLPTTANLLGNASFEDGLQPWAGMNQMIWGRQAFELSTAQARTGKYAARVDLNGNTPKAKTELAGVAQELLPARFPRTLRGSYFVEQWQPGGRRPYIQWVVIVFGATDRPVGLPAAANNHQIRAPIVGLTQPAFAIRNAKWHITGPTKPTLNQWIDFEVNLHDLFKKKWGNIPQNFQSIRVFYELRWDGGDARHGPTQAVVYFDDLYLGDEKTANR